VSEPRNKTMTVLIKRKTGGFATFRKLQILANENVLLGEISQDESIELKIMRSMNLYSVRWTGLIQIKLI